MSADRETTRIVRSWLQRDEHESAERVLGTVLGRLDTTPQRRPLWRAWRSSLMSNTMRFAAAGAVALVVAVVGLTLYFSRPAVTPAASPTPIASAQANQPTQTAVVQQTDGPTVQPTPTSDPGGLIVYERLTQIANGIEGACVTPSATGCTQWSSVFVINQDGSDPREVTPGVWSAKPQALSPDGTRLIVDIMFRLGEGQSGNYLTDLHGSGLQLIDTSCLAPCIGDSGLTFSPDGERVAFIRSFGTREPIIEVTERVVAVMDWSTGEVDELDSTRVRRDPLPGDFCPGGCRYGVNEPPRWSPDGSRLIFTRSDIPNPDDPAIRHTVTFLVDDDGGKLRQLVDTELFARDARWSPDGTEIVFTSAVESVTGPRSVNYWHQLNDIYTVFPDGTGLTRLTTFTEGQNPSAPGEIGALRPTWTSDGRIVFLLIPPPPGDESVLVTDLWVMNGDGRNAQELDAADVAMLTSIGCTQCPYPPLEDHGDLRSTAFWGPRR